MTETKTETKTPGPASPDSPFPLPRVTIRFCTQCKWMLRAAYFAQELLSTFSTSLGEVALQPSTGGTFIVEIFFQTPSTTSSSPSSPTVQQRVLWDRKVDGGFPETKELKRRVRDAIEPGRDLGHVDKDYSASSKAAKTEVVPAANISTTATADSAGGPACKPGTGDVQINGETQECEDCK
ncbi:Rdx family-domain-containing protein [Hypoxylon crocopeplum]|nr:Rdx family-domain-containing protein [Hypoxylon crocopeplum]